MATLKISKIKVKSTGKVYDISFKNEDSITARLSAISSQIDDVKNDMDTVKNETLELVETHVNNLVSDISNLETQVNKNTSYDDENDPIVSLHNQSFDNYTRNKINSFITFVSWCPEINSTGTGLTECNVEIRTKTCSVEDDGRQFNISIGLISLSYGGEDCESPSMNYTMHSGDRNIIIKKIPSSYDDNAEYVTPSEWLYGKLMEIPSGKYNLSVTIRNFDKQTYGSDLQNQSPFGFYRSEDNKLYGFESISCQDVGYAGRPEAGQPVRGYNSFNGGTTDCSRGYITLRVSRLALYTEMSYNTIFSKFSDINDVSVRWSIYRDGVKIGSDESVVSFISSSGQILTEYIQTEIPCTSGHYEVFTECISNSPLRHKDDSGYDYYNMGFDLYEDMHGTKTFIGSTNYHTGAKKTFPEGDTL